MQQHVDDGHQQHGHANSHSPDQQPMMPLASIHAAPDPGHPTLGACVHPVVAWQRVRLLKQQGKKYGEETHAFIIAAIVECLGRVRLQADKKAYRLRSMPAVAPHMYRSVAPSW